MSAVMTEERMWEADDVAAYIGMTKQWVYAEVRKGALPHVKLGRYVRFRRAAIDEWLASRESGKIARHTK